jgi:hypothetical protein
MALRRHVRLVAAAVALLVGAGGPPAQTGLQDENLLTPMPPGFKLSWQTPDGHMQAFVRPPDTLETWSTLITIQIIRGLSNMNPDGFADRLATHWTSGCPGGSGQKVRGGNENGFPIVLWVYLCPLDPATHKPETMFLKAISGADSLYVTQYDVREAASKEMAVPATAFLGKVMACDTRRADRPCPAPLK